MTEQYPQGGENRRRSRPTGGPTGGQTGAMGGQGASGSMRGSRQQPMGGGQPTEQMGGQRSMGEGGQMTGQQPMGGSQQPMGGGQQMAPMRSFEDHLTNELRILLEDFSEVTHVAEWCAKECAYAGPELATCARICEDIAEVAELNEKMIARDSPFGPELAETFIRVATEGLPELRHHQQRHPHVAETVATIDRAINSCSALLESGGQAGPMQQRGGTQGGQMGQY